jgi:hypothetical protein
MIIQVLVLVDICKREKKKNVKGTIPVLIVGSKTTLK